MASKYDLKEIHTLLTKAYDETGLRRMINLNNDFRPLRNHIANLNSLSDVTDALIDYCERCVLLNELLEQIKGDNPKQYEANGPYHLDGDESDAASRGDVLTIYQPIILELLRVPAGVFLMGSDPGVDKDARDDEHPQHRLYLPDFWMTKTPVTNVQYATFVQATKHEAPDDWKYGQVPKGKAEHPVVSVNWYDAVAFCKWLSDEIGRLIRLPTEAEWEKAARGEDGRIYPWGYQWDTARCNSKEGGLGRTTPVEAYPNGSSPYGLLDMAGNVREWCTTEVRKSYPYKIEDEWAEDYVDQGISRVSRGGAWCFIGVNLRCATRFRAVSVNRFGYVGFRVVSPI